MTIVGIPIPSCNFQLFQRDTKNQKKISMKDSWAIWMERNNNSDKRPTKVDFHVNKDTLVLNEIWMLIKHLERLIFRKAFRMENNETWQKRFPFHLTSKRICTSIAHVTQILHSDTGKALYPIISNFLIEFFWFSPGKMKTNSFSICTLTTNVKRCWKVRCERWTRSTLCRLIIYQW